jgi:soluble lytic murein transglycosylase-like protein
VVALCLAAGVPAHAAEHVILKNGFEMDCSRVEVMGDRVRLYMGSGEANYQDLASDAIARMETVPDPPAAVVNAKDVPQGLKPLPATKTYGTAEAVPLSKAEMHQMLAHAGESHNIDEDLLASVVRAESGGQVRAVSRAGAQGLMQLMPGTATQLGVKDAFRPDENIAGGTAYLDALLIRYHDNVALALAAYNAGPEAVDKYHGIPPYRETRAYVARVIREFNRRKLAAHTTEQVARAK